MSFGTAWWPEQDDRVWAVIDGLIEKRQPFLFSHPSPFMHFPNEVKKKIDASGIALELSWSPQELILTHPVTGWFLTHGGWNSMQEAFTHCIPMCVLLLSTFFYSSFPIFAGYSGRSTLINLTLLCACWL